jgi:hypothetical protein
MTNNGKPEGTRLRGRPTLRLMESVKWIWINLEEGTGWKNLETARIRRVC